MSSKKSSRPSTSKSKASAIGAPSQFKQANRKGKKAWRKNIDVQPEEQALEDARAEERLTGGHAAMMSENQMFSIDTTGDEMVAKRVKKPRTLRSLEILSQRSAVPALSSKATAPPAPKTNKAKVSHADKERLRRIARKTQVGSDGQGLGSAVISVRKTEPLRDVWTERETEAQRLANVKGKWEEVVEPQPAPKAPLTIEQQRQIHAYTAQTKSVPVPRDGQSYNPKLESHQTLLDAAIAQEIALLKKETDAEKKLERYKQVIQNRRQVAQEDDADLINGMMVAAGDPEALAEEIGLEVEDIGEGSDSNEMGNAFAKPTRRKTQAEKNKAKRRIEQARLAKQAATIKQQRKSMEILSKLKSSVEASAQDRARLQAARRAAKQAERLTGYQGGEKVGKHRVLEDSIDVQLGEDLSENVREIKPEGNLFRERFRSMQSRSLVEPRVRQLPKRNTLKIREYEKHGWKRFE